MRPDLLVHPVTRVLNGQRDIWGRRCIKLIRYGTVECFVGRHNRYFATLQNGIPCIKDKVHDDLLKLAKVCFYPANTLIQPGFQLDILPDQTTQHTLHSEHNLIDIQHLCFKYLFTAERNQLPGQRGGLFHGFFNLKPLTVQRILLKNIE